MMLINGQMEHQMTLRPGERNYVHDLPLNTEPQI